MKKVRVITLLMALLLLIAGCSQQNKVLNYASKAYQATLDLGYTSSREPMDFACYFQYPDKSAITQFPEEDIARKLPESGYIFFFHDGFWSFAYTDLEGNVIYAYDARKYTEEVDALSELSNTIPKTQSELSVLSYQLGVGLEEAKKDQAIVESIVSEGITASLIDSGVFGGETNYTSFTSDELAQIANSAKK